MKKSYPKSMLPKKATSATKVSTDVPVSFGKHDINNLDQLETDLYNRIVDKGIDGDLSYFLPVLVAAAADQLDEMFSASQYWESVASPQVWKELVLQLVREAFGEYLPLLKSELAKTTAKLEKDGSNPLPDERARTIAITEITTARTAATVLLVDLNNGIASGAYL
jgi:hypothetical protein